MTQTAEVIDSRLDKIKERVGIVYHMQMDDGIQELINDQTFLIGAVEIYKQALRKTLSTVFTLDVLVEAAVNVAVEDAMEALKNK